MATEEMTLPAAARLLGVHRTRVHQLVVRGKLTARKIGANYIITRAEVERYRKAKAHAQKIMDQARQTV